ncbi:MAG: hypothetical protein ACTSYD_11540 [Candidatus Heimdallarchaeaceae archaeon]
MKTIRIEDEMRVAYERIRLSIAITSVWFIISILIITGTLTYVETSSATIGYMVLSIGAILLLLLGLGIQVEPLIRLLIKDKNKNSEFWESEIKLKPKFKIRCLISETLTIAATIMMIIAMIFISI